jgi:glycosyltransferase involved in cell wall biosynthesis
MARAAPELVSVVMPVRNGEEHIEDQLAALAAQTYTGRWELVVVDNGSTDATVEIVERWRSRFPSLRTVDASERRGVNHARNCGAAEARGEFLAFCDADDVAEPAWLGSLVEAGASADIVAGMSDVESLNPPELRAWRPGRSREQLPLMYSFLPTVDGGNCGMWARVARDLGWDESFRTGSADIEFSWRAQLAGYVVGPNAGAVMMKRHRATLRGLARQWYGYGRAHPHLYRSFRSSGMPRGGATATLRRWWWVLAHTPDLLRSRGQRGNWVRLAALASGRVVGSVRWRTVYFSDPGSTTTQRRGPHLVDFGIRWPPETFVSRRLEGLAARGFRVTVASFEDSAGGHAPPTGVGNVRVLQAGWSRARVCVGAGTSLLRLLVRCPRRLPAVSRAARAGSASRVEAVGRFAAYATMAALRPDVVHFEWSAVANEHSALPGALNRPAVVSCHGGELQIYPYTKAGRATTAALPRIFGRAAAVHCVSEALVSEAIRFGAEPDRIHLIRAAVDPDFFCPLPRSCLDHERFAVVAVGTLRWVKGFEYALLAIAELAQEGIPVSLDILGGDPEWEERSERERLLQVAVDLGLSERVRLHGRVTPEAVRDRLRTSNVYLQSSLSEGHPTAVVEAMACGLPIVATDCGGTREAVTDGVEGFLVMPRDSRGAATALRILWGDPQLRDSMGRAGRERVEREFTLDLQTERFAALYGDVVDGCS